MLEVQLSITGRGLVERLTIGRLEHLAAPSYSDEVLDEVHTYRVRYNGVIVGEVSHRYGDGALTLTRKALELADNDANDLSSQWLRNRVTQM